MRKSETYRNEIKSYIVRTGMTMTEVVDYLSDEYAWSRSVPNLSGKLKRGSLRYGEAVELADAGRQVRQQKSVAFIDMLFKVFVRTHIFPIKLFNFPIL